MAWKERNEKEEWEKREKDPLRVVFSGLVLLLLGVTFYLATKKVISWSEWWAYFIFGLGILFLVDALIRKTVPEYRRPVSGRIFAGVLFVGLGLVFIYGVTDWWPFIFVVIGLWLILKGLIKIKKRA